MPFFIERQGKEIAKYFEREEAMQAAIKLSNEIAEQAGVFPAGFYPRGNPAVLYHCDFPYGDSLEVVFRLKPVVDGAEPGGGRDSGSSKES